MNITRVWQSITKPSSPVAGDTLTLSTSFQSFATSVTIPSSAFFAKRSFQFEVFGNVNVTVAVNIIAAVFLGSTQIAATSAFSLGILSNGGYKGEINLNVITAGSSGVIEVQGISFFTTTSTQISPVLLTNTAAISAINLSIDQVLTVQVKATSGLGSGTISQRMLNGWATMAQVA